MLGSVLAKRKDENRALPIESFAISRETTDANSIHYSFFGSSTQMNGLENAAKHKHAGTFKTLEFAAQSRTHFYFLPYPNEQTFGNILHNAICFPRIKYTCTTYM